MKTTVIYHSADFDGIFCREIARKFLPDAELIGWNFGDPLINPPADGMLYILDLSPDCMTGINDLSSLVWIDHHKTSIEKYPAPLAGYRIDGVAACRLAWQWFTIKRAWTHEPAGKDSFGVHYNEFWRCGHETTTIRPVDILPTKQAFIDRKVSEPMAVRLAGEYDIWDKRDPLAETFQYALRVKELTPQIWESLLDGSIEDTLQIERSQIMTMALMNAGHAAQTYAQKTDADLVTYKSFRVKFEGLDFLCLNTGRFNSLTFSALDNPETGHDALMGFMFNGKVWTVSIYHAKHRMDLDLSEIAKKHGGGGHKGACGFTCKYPPFL